MSSRHGHCANPDNTKNESTDHDHVGRYGDGDDTSAPYQDTLTKVLVQDLQIGAARCPPGEDEITRWLIADIAEEHSRSILTERSPKDAVAVVTRSQTNETIRSVIREPYPPVKPCASATIHAEKSARTPY